ncbi:2TM domain-containing protein [Aureibaculum sp. A20]|uniref:2TM domain-containing protein n=1 Tax=Aureibaculum flavum TaxID=2795986 RepID=A0ABS0WP47_9FLAO|nr:2TM domain-containing protein [Aureibaculum flavum]MBJ2173761.1 2TM domain-containing protein [Aureibaculum flavum]
MEKEQIEIYEKARKRVRQKKRLYYHFIVFLVGSLFIIVLNTFFKVGSQYGEWFKYVVALWLLIWIFHFINVFVTNKFFGKEWERIETEKLMDKHEMKSDKLERELIKQGVITPNDKISGSEKKTLNH